MQSFESSSSSPFYQLPGAAQSRHGGVASASNSQRYAALSSRSPLSQITLSREESPPPFFDETGVVNAAGQITKAILQLSDGHLLRLIVDVEEGACLPGFGID